MVIQPSIVFILKEFKKENTDLLYEENKALKKNHEDFYYKYKPS